MTAIEKQSNRRGDRGGRRPGAGRPKGRKDTKTLQIEAAAREFTVAALGALQQIAKKGKSESARVAAATALLDRGWGRPRQALALTDADGGPLEVLVRRVIVKP